MTVIHARAPLRLGLAGGGTDLTPYCDIYGGYVLNATIDRYAYATIKTHKNSIVRIKASDLKIQEEFSLTPQIPVDGALKLHKAVYNYMVKNFNNGMPIKMELLTSCDAPLGSGLGSSSTIVVAIITAFVELLNLTLDDYSIANMAYEIERIDCGFAGGKQDQYSATFGGFNLMEFYANDRSIVNSLNIKDQYISALEASSLIYFTGISRDSSYIIADQSRNVETETLSAIEAMHEMKAQAKIMKECLLRGDLAGVSGSVMQGWKNKKKSAKSVSNSHIDSVYDAALEVGAIAGKVSGAGGGGFMWFFVDIEKRMDVRLVLERFGGEVSNVTFTKTGAESWSL